MNDEPLMDAVVQSVLFLELSDGQTVNEDAAIAVLEQLGLTLQRLEPVAKQRFVEYVGRRAKGSRSSAERATLEGLAADLGLVSE